MSTQKPPLKPIENNPSPINKFIIDGEERHLDQSEWENDIDTFARQFGQNKFNMVYVNGPNGKTQPIPIADVKGALSNGYTLMDDTESYVPKKQKPQSPPSPGEVVAEKAIGANTRNQIGHTFGTLNQEARNTMQEAEEVIANLPQIPKLPGQTNLEYAMAVTAAADKAAEPLREKEKREMGARALPITTQEIDRKLDKIDGELATLGQQRYGKLDANPAYGNPMLMGIDMNAHRRAKLYAENKDRIDELERERVALEAQKSMLKSIEKYQEYDRKGDKSGISNFFRAIKVGGDLQALASFGLTKMQEDLDFAQILERAHKGEKLVLDERKALQMYINLQKIAAMDRGAHFNSGLGMQQTFEFMRDIFLAGMTGGASAGNLIAQYGVKGAIKQLGKNTAKKAAEVYLKTALTPSFYKNLTSEIVDNYKLKYSGGDTFKADKKRSALSLLYRTWAETGAEYFTETLSGLIGNVGIAKRIAKTARGKGMLSKAFRKFDEIHDRTKQNPIGGKILEGLSKIGVGNIPEELFEEIAVVPLQSITLGENRMGQLLDPRFYQEVLISTAAIGGMNSATNILVGGTTAAIEKRKTNNKIKELRTSLDESLRGSNETVQSAYDRFISNLENENFYDEEGVFAPESILDDLQALRDATNNDEAVMSQAEEYAKYHIFKQGQTEALRAIAEEELGPIEYGNSASVVPFLDMADGKTYHKLGETKDVVILGTNDKSIPGGKIVVPRSSLNGKELDPIPISEYVTDYFIHKPTPTKVETLDDISEIRQQGATASEPVISPEEPAPSADGKQHFGGVAAPGNVINVGDTAAYGERVVKVVDIYEGADKKIEATIEDENGEQHVVSFGDLAPVVHQDNSTKTRYILPDGRRAVVQSSNGDNVTLGVLDDNNQVVEEIPSTMEEVLTLDKVQAEEAEVIETAAAEMAAGGTETAQIGTEDLPRDKEGNIDYDTLLTQSPTRFVEQMRADFGTEVADAQMGKMVGNIDAKITKLQEKADKETSPNKVASMLKEIRTLQGQRDAISAALAPIEQEEVSDDDIDDETYERLKSRLNTLEQRLDKQLGTPAASAQAPEGIAPNANNIASDATSAPIEETSTPVEETFAPNEEIKPVGEGPFGKIYNQFKGKAREAIAFLRSIKEGEAIGALHHKDIGDIDLVWGVEGTGKSDGYGLSKLVKYHPEVLDNLQEIINDMQVVSRSVNRIQLESTTHQAAVRLTWDNEKKNWLLTAFEKKNSVLDNTTDTGKTSSGSKENDTATLQDTVSDDKDTTVSETSSGVEEKKLTKPKKTILENAQDTVESAEIDAAAQEVNTEPTEAQKEAGNYKKGHYVLQGLNISIEQPKGSTRSGKDPNGKKWTVKMNNHYGYIRGTQGKDKDHIDVFIGDSPTSKKVFVVDQVGRDGSFDEHKVMIGFDTLEEARAAYLSNYEEGWQGLGAITETSMDGFKEWISDGTPKTRRFAEYAQGIPESYMKRAAQWQKKLGIGITIYNSIDDIKEKSVQEQLRAGIGVSGWISRDDNGALKEIGIYLPYINSKADVDKTAIHEIVAHYGLKGLLGEDKYNELCDNVWELMRPYEQDQYLHYPGVNNARQAADEYIAHLAESMDAETLSRSDKSIWEKIVEAVKNFFAPHKKTDVDLTDAISGADLSTLLRASYARLAENSGKKTQPKKPSKFKLEDAVLKEKNSTRPALTGIYHDSGYKVATNTNVLVALKEDYPKSAEGKVFVKGKPIPQSNFPKWQILFNDKFEKSNIPVDFDKLIEKLSTIKKNEGKMPYYVSLKANDGQVYYYHPNSLMIFAKAAKEIGGELMMQRINQGLNSESAKLIITSPRGKAMIMPMGKIRDSVNIYDISFVDENTPVAQFVEKHKTKENLTETEPKPKKTKEKPTASKEVSSTPSKGKVQDQKIEDFGEKIGGARKDVARQRVRDAVNLTNVDLQKLADPDKILSKANIIKSLREGTMTKEDAITLMAMNNTVRCADSTEKYIMMPKYRDMALAWTNGQSPIFHITDKDIEDRFDQIGEHIKTRMSDAQVEKHKQNIKKYYDILYGYYSDYIKTYRDLDYPNVERKLGGAIIRKFSHSDSFWVLKKADARRGRTFRAMEAAIAYMEREYPVVVAKAKEDKTSADDSQKVGHLRVVKDSTGWFRIKSSEIPGEIYFSKSFSSRKGAEEYLQENRDMLIAKEQRAIDALMGSNIGMAERQGPDYRNGKDVTSDEYLKAFGFRGVEFGNWVPQAERQMYLNKSYDAIMDICSILGISPKAFSLGGKLAIAFGARGHSKAMAHYESSKQVINLTRMKGVGSFAHEWFHAIDNYLARENSGNTMEFVTEKHPTKRQELYDAFNEFVSKMNTLDYTRRSRRAGDYWGSVIERAARMFESYIYTELGAKDISSPLLVGRHSVLSDEYLLDSDISSYPIPTAEETRQIKPYLDKIFSTIQEEVDADDNHILFRVAENVGSFEDAISKAKDKGYENLSAYPDVTNQMLEDALTSGRIMVYSKDPIAGGTTVSPSVQRASELSGPDAQIYSKDISIDQVAWETPDEGTYTTNDDIRFRFIGEQGAANLDRAEEATIRMDNLAVAREMETAGKDAKTIKIATGWERGADKKWRYEVDDDIEFDSPVDRLEMLKEEYASVVRDKDKIIRLLNMYPTKGRTEQQKEQIKQLDKKHKSLIAKTDALLDSIHDAERELSGMSLEDLIGEDNNLFKEYPQLADINVSFMRNSRFGNYKGFYSPSENTIWISPDNGQPASTLVHELQHAIQHIEGFARGGNTSTGNELRDKAKAWSWKKQLEQTEKEHPELAGSIRLQATLEDEYKADGMEDKMPSKEIRTTGFNLYVRGYDNEGYESAYDQWEKIGLIDNPKDYSTYKRLAGEVEARNVQTRKWMPTSVRRETLAVDTEYNDVAREDQIFIMDGIAAQNDVRFRAEGLESLVERTYRKDGSFSFSGKNKIESADDVAFIFKQLEDSAIENAFLVFVKEGKPTILHVGMGNVSQSIIDSSVVLPAYKDFGADKVYMVHNHPSGNLVASKPDIDMLLLLKAQLPKASVEGIIINTLSGNYAVINDGEIKPILETQDTVELEMLSFSKNVFSPEYKSTMAERKISGPESIAAYLSAHRLGSGSKVGALLLNQSNVINGNLVTNSNEVSTENAQELAREIAEAANRCSANSVVLFGDFDYSDKAIAKLQKQIPIVSGMSVTMLDVVRLNGKHTQSLHDMTLPSRSTLSDGVRFRVEQAKDRVENLFTAAISGSFRGKSISIGNLTLEGKKYLESISGIKFKDKVDFVLNPSDLIHIYNEHYGDNEKDPGNNIPLTINDIRNIVDVILTPEKVIYLGEDEGKRFAFLAPAGNGAYNLIEIYATKKGNLSSKTFYKTKKGVSHRAMILKKESKHSTSETNEATLSDAKVPILFDVANISENTVFRISDQNTLRDNLQAAITGYIVGTNTTGDVISTDDMVNTIYDYVENAGESSLKSNLVKELDAYEQNVQSGELNDGVISAEELLIENVHDIINMYSDEVMFRADQNPLVQNEIQSIVDAAKANGTYMKAPNGKPSNLNPEQWAMVRTENFKRWFGDWEKDARASMIMKLPAISLDKMTPLTKKQAEAVVMKLEKGENKYDGRKTTWVISSIGKIIGHKGFDNSLLIPKLKEVYDNSIYLMSEPEIRKDGHKEHNNFVGYHHYVGKITFDGTEYYVRLTLQEVKTRKKDFIPNQLHSTFVSDIEIYSTNNRVNTGNTPATANVDAKYVDAKLEQFFENANNSSKIVDENGEPRVVYHGTSNVFNTFEMHDGSLGKGAYFSSNWDEAAEYSLKKLGFSKDEYDELPYDEAIVVEAFLNVRDEHNITHSRFSREDIEVLATSPNQIKSATDNIGTFDSANPDIRFRAVPTTTAEDIDKNGFRSYLSEKDYDRMKKEILKGAPILRMSLYTPDEYISSVIDKLTQQSPPDATEALQMASSVRDAFTRAGIVLDMSDNEIIYALWKEVNPSDAITIKEKLENNHKSNDVRYRIDSSIGPNTNDIKLTRGEQLRENWVDKMLTVKMLQDLVKKRGGTVDDNLNPYITENLSLGRQQRENELFQENIYRPMVEQVTAIEKLFVKEGLASKDEAYKAVNDFLYARHAPERNRHVMIGEIENYITRAITPEEMKFISGDNPRAEIRALATRIYNVYANGVADTSEVFAKNMLNTRYKSKDLNERLKEFRNKFLGTVKGAKEYTEKVFNSKRGTNRSGMSDKEAKEILNKYYVKSTQAELDKLSDLVRESTHFTLDTWYKYNMISAKERDNYKSMYKYYIPLRNWEVSEDIDYSELTNQAFNHASEIISTNKKAHGRSSRADNPLAYIASLAQSAIVLGNKNQVRLNMYRLVLKNLNILGDIATIPKVYFVKNNATGEITQTTERPEQELFDQGLVETKTNKDYRWHKTGAEYQAHLIPVIINGDRHLIEMRGEFGVKIASAINNTNSVHLSYLDATRPVTQWLSATRTSYNPEFIPTNFARDFMFGNMAYAVEGGNILKLNRNLGRAFKAINRSELGAKYKDQYDRYYEEFMNEGAQTGFMNMRNIETMKKDLEKMHKQMLRAGGKLSDMKNFAIKFGSAGIQYLNAMSENAMRFAVYLTEREKGASAKQAAFAAKEITVNFNRKGRYTENMGALYSFFNASVQGTARLYDLTKKHGKRTAVALAALTTIKLASDLICVLFAGDDYDELSDYVKFSNILIPIGVQEDGRMKFLKIPMAQGVRGVTNIADVTVDVLRGTKTVLEAAKTFFLNNVGEHLPLSFEAIDLTGRDSMASFITPFLPSVAVPFYESWRNVDFKGDPIYREDFTLGSKEYLPRYTRAYNSTNPVYVELSRGLNALAGGNDELTSAIKMDENGNISRRWYGYAFDINPAIVEHIIDGFMGGITTFPSNTIKTISSAISDEKEVELYNVPIVNRFVSVPTYKEGYDLYFRTSDLVRDIQASEKAVKAVGDIDAYSSIRNNGFNREITRVHKIYDKRVKYLKELKENSNLSTQQMKDIEARMDEVMKEASAAFEKIYNKYDNNIERYEED